MIRDEIGTLIDRLSPLNVLGAEVPALKLDLSWPSIGTLDKVLFPLRGNQSLANEERGVVDSAAAYTGLIAYHCWTSFPDNPRVELGCNEFGEVELSARGGKLLPSRDTWKVNLTRWLTSVLQSNEPVIDIFPSHRRTVLTSTNLLSNSALGICAAFTPWGEGPWKERRIDELGGHFQATEAQLASMCAGYYREVFSLEKEGTLSSLYSSGLIFPPLELNEPFPGQYGVTSVIKHLEETKASPESVKNLALNLALFPDDTISTIGLALACATAESLLPRRLLAAVDARAAVMPRLRPAYLLARRVLSLPGDWTGRVNSDQKEELEPLASRELRLGLIPLVEIPIPDLLQPELTPLVESLVWDNPLTSLEVIQALRSSGVTLGCLDIQEAGLFLKVGENVPATALLTSVLRESGKYSAALLGRTYRLLGHIAMLESKLDKAEKFLTQAVARLRGEAQLLVDCAQKRANVAALKGNYSLAIEHANSGLKADAANVTCRLIRMRLLEIMGNDHDSQQELIDIARYAPTDDRVVQELLNFRWLPR